MPAPAVTTDATTGADVTTDCPPAVSVVIVDVAPVVSVTIDAIRQ
jgi:hypothetical protein